MAAAPAELAEETTAYLPPRPTFERVDRGDLVYVAGPRSAIVSRVRVADVDEAVDWARAESRRRGLNETGWWVGWSATPADVAERLLHLGLVPDEVPTLTGMTCETPPPAADRVDVRPVETRAEHLEAIQVDWEVWNLGPDERAERRRLEVERFDEIQASGLVHHFSAFDGDRRVGFGRAIDLEQGVALMGGAVLADARGRGVYRALVRARWDHAVARGTPLLVVQAGDMSAPVLAGLGFRAHGVILLFTDRL
ncbi:MAG TPA: GNAT family N-acetyltransferase [Gaiellaceae bacterium]|nr:GNAT family N-acetyltransferase [Gaiellaceae bacterium]